MKFPRNARIFRGQLDAAPFAIVFFLLVMFLMLGTVVYTPGVRVQLPVANGLPGTDRPTVAVTIAKGGQLYFQNQVIEAKELRGRLAAAAKTTAEPLTLIVLMDAEVTGQMLMNLSLLARDAGITELSWAAAPGTRPGPAGRSIK